MYENADAVPSAFVEGGRFYSVITADLDGDGTTEIIAGGQKGPQKSHQGYVAAYALKENRLCRLSEDTFSVTFDGRKMATRIRSIVALKDPDSAQWEIYVAGRGGKDEAGIGFLRKSIFHPSEKRFQEIDTHAFYSPEAEYTHGYPISLWRFHGEKNPCVVYGGFSGSQKGDKADIRVFRTGARKHFKDCFLRPFADLPIPLRVNALSTGDIDGDGKEDILIAGRTKTDTVEVAAFACWSNGRVYHEVLQESIPSRWRTLLITDLNNDGKCEIITGGRIDVGELFLARLELWHFDSQSFRLTSRYCWTGDGSTRLRALALHPQRRFLSAVGRSQLLSNGDPVWQGFVRQFSLEKGRLVTIQKPFYLKEGPETRIRDATFLREDQLLTAGFITTPEKRDTGFIMVLPFSLQ
jgi:hypothetical protein